MFEDGDWLTASDIAEQSFCPESRRLKLQGAKPSAQSHALMERGVKEHIAWSRRTGRASHLSPALIFMLAVFGFLLWYGFFS